MRACVGREGVSDSFSFSFSFSFCSDCCSFSFGLLLPFSLQCNPIQRLHFSTQKVPKQERRKREKEEDQLTRLWSMISTMVASFPAHGPSDKRTTRPTSTYRLKVLTVVVGAADMICTRGGREREEGGQRGCLRERSGWVEEGLKGGRRSSMGRGRLMRFSSCWNIPP